jgi:thiosulfate dehydrogenase
MVGLRDQRFPFNRIFQAKAFSLPSLTATLIICLAAGHSYADSTAGAALARQGSDGVPACAICHGPNGEGQAAAGFPRLAGQSRGYLLKQLQDFAGGQRTNPQMAPIASALSEQQRRDAADYYGGLPKWQAQEGVSRRAPQDNLGYTLASRGNWNKDIPACFACHGQGGVGVPPHFPALAGQSASYTRAQLEAWKSGQRDNDPQGLMKSVASRMSAAEITAASIYFENPTPIRKDK